MGLLASHWVRSLSIVIIIHYCAYTYCYYNNNYGDTKSLKLVYAKTLSAKTLKLIPTINSNLKVYRRLQTLERQDRELRMQEQEELERDTHEIVEGVKALTI